MDRGPRVGKSGTPGLGGGLQQLLGAGLHCEARILLRLGPRDRGDALREIVDEVERVMAA